MLFHFFRIKIPSLFVMGIFWISLILILSLFIAREISHLGVDDPAGSSVGAHEIYHGSGFSGEVIIAQSGSQIPCHVEALGGDSVFFEQHLSRVLSHLPGEVALTHETRCELILTDLSTHHYGDLSWSMLSGALTLTMSGAVGVSMSQDVSISPAGDIYTPYTDTIEWGSLVRDPSLPPNIALRITESLGVYEHQSRVMRVASGVLAIHPRVFPTPWRSPEQEVIYLRSTGESEWVISSYGFPQVPPESARVGRQMSGSYMALTFDDGPHPIYTPRVLDILAAHQQKATFCVLGSQAKKHPDLIIRIIQEGHELCNHSWSHPDFAKLTLSGVYHEITETDRVLAQILSGAGLGGVSLFLVRPPYGSLTREIEYSIPRGWLLWDQDSLDWKSHSKAVILKRLGPPRSGSIVLFHDIHPQGIDALDEYLRSAQTLGISSVGVSDLLGEYDRFDHLGESILSRDRIQFLKSPKLTKLRVLGE